MSNANKGVFNYFSKFEIVLWLSSVLLIILAFLIFDRKNDLTLCASLLGVTSLIFNAKGNPAGQVLIIAFSILYGIISYSFRYYGEMITYIGMTLPMAVVSLFSWLKNPYKGNKSQVRVSRMTRKSSVLMILLTISVTVIFYFILKYFNTNSLLISTISVTTSFLAVWLTFKRSAFYAIAYAANDIVLIILWSLASRYDISYVSVAVCFVVFFVNDIYGFVSWNAIRKNQELNQ